VNFEVEELFVWLPLLKNVSCCNLYINPIIWKNMARQLFNFSSLKRIISKEISQLRCLLKYF